MTAGEGWSLDRRFVEYRRSGDRALRNALVAEHLPFVKAVARRYLGRHEPRDDLEQVAALGLIKALDRFDPDRGVPFRAFALPTVLGELRRHFRDHCGTLRPPRPLRDRYRLVRTVVTDLWQELGRSPSAHEIAARAGLTADEVLETLDAHRAEWSARDSEFDAAADDTPSREFQAAEARAIVTRLARGLPRRDRDILYLRYVEERSQRDIADRVGLSQMQVSRILNRLHEQLGRRLAG